MAQGGPERIVPSALAAAQQQLPSALAAAKQRLRRAALARRALLDEAALASTAAALRRVALDRLLIPYTVAGHLSIGGEPGTGPLLEALHARGVRILLPVLREDLDLDWAPYAGTDHLRPGLRGTREPDAVPLGRDAIAEAELILVPGLLAGRDGSRLGRGGGSYDRALARRSAHAVTVMLAHPEEVVDSVPTEPHDARIDAVLTPTELIKVGQR